jgi:hypothetical protein
MKEVRAHGIGSSFSKLRYVQDIRLLCKLRLLIGKKRDGCILLNQKLSLNRKKYLESKVGTGLVWSSATATSSP